MPIRPSGWLSSTTTATAPRRPANAGGSASSASCTAARTCSSVSDPRTVQRVDPDKVRAVDALRKRMSAVMEGRLPGLFGVELLSIEHGATETRLALRPEHLAPNDFLHAGTVITLADTSAGMGCLASLPESAVGFTTIELKTNFLATAREGALRCK